MINIGPKIQIMRKDVRIKQQVRTAIRYATAIAVVAVALIAVYVLAAEKIAQHVDITESAHFSAVYGGTDEG